MWQIIIPPTPAPKTSVGALTGAQSQLLGTDKEFLSSRTLPLIQKLLRVLTLETSDTQVKGRCHGMPRPHAPNHLQSSPTPCMPHPHAPNHLQLHPPTLRCHSNAHCISLHNHATPVARLNSDQCLISLDLVSMSWATTYLSFSPYATFA